MNVPQEKSPFEDSQTIQHRRVVSNSMRRAWLPRCNGTRCGVGLLVGVDVIDLRFDVLDLLFHCAQTVGLEHTD